LPGDIDGLIYSSELSVNEGEEEVIRKYKKGDTIEAIVLSIDVDKERVSLGIKPADDDHFAQYISLHGKGEKVEGQVKSEDAKGFVIALAEDVEGYLRVSESEYASIEQAREVLKDGTTVSGTILNVDRKARRVFISQKTGSKPQEAAKPAAEPEKNDTTNFGALLKAELNAQK
jgi:small subunit ribosomal protein S1